MAKKAKKKQGPSFDFGEPSESLKKVIELLRPKQRPGTPDDDALAQWALDVIFAERYRRISVIAEHYGADTASPIGCLQLAMILADDFVPNFSPLSSLNGRGRPRLATKDHRDSYDDLKLSLDVLTIVKKRRCSVSRACQHLSNREGSQKGDSPEMIEANFYRINKALDRRRDTIEAARQQMRVDEANRPLMLSDIGKTRPPNATENGDEFS